MRLSHFPGRQGTHIFPKMEILLQEGFSSDVIQGSRALSTLCSFLHLYQVSYTRVVAQE